MISPTYGSCSDDQVVRIIVNYIRANYKTSEGFNLIVGTDSQNYSDTKMQITERRCFIPPEKPPVKRSA